MRRLGVFLAALLVAASAHAHGDLDKITVLPPQPALPLTSEVPIQSPGWPGARRIPLWRAVQDVIKSETQSGTVWQPACDDLTSICDLDTEAFGRGLLECVDASTCRSYLGAGSPTTDTTCLDAGVSCLFAGSASEGGPATSALTSTNADNLTLDPSDCSAGNVATAIDRQGDLTCTADDDAPECADLPAFTGDVTNINCAMTIPANAVAFSELSGTATDAQIPDDISINYAATSGSSQSTETVLLADGDDTDENAQIPFAKFVDNNEPYDLFVDPLFYWDDDIDRLYADETESTAFFGPLYGTATNADNLTLDPTDCAANTFATSIDRQADLTCAGITDADVPNSITVDLAATASALAANGANCSAGQYPLGVNASGAAESCTADDDAPECADLPAFTGDVTSSAGSCALNIAADAVGAAEIAAGAVGTSEVSDNSLTNADIGTGAILSDEIADGTVTPADQSVGHVGMYWLTSGQALADSTSLVACFPTAIDAYTVVNGGRYTFEMFVTIDKVGGTSAHALQFGFLGTSNVEYWYGHSMQWIGTTSTAPYVARHFVAVDGTKTNVSASTSGTANETYSVMIQGTIEVGGAGGGTLIPAFAWSADPGTVTAQCQAPTIFKIYPLGNASGINMG